MNKLFTILIVLLLAATGFAQQEYGHADWSRTDAWTKTGLIEHWVLDPGTRGTSIPNGSMELWDGAEGGCTACPTDWNCTCTGGDIVQETTELFDLNSSAELQVNALTDPILSIDYDFDANQCYQITFWTKGEDGTEDLIVAVGLANFTETYDWTSDTWTAPLTSQLYGNISTTWTRRNLWLTTGALAKAGRIIGFSDNTGQGTAIYIDGVEVRELHTCDIYGSRRNALSVPVGSDPLWGAAKAALQRVGTGPAGWWGMLLDGSDDYVLCADADCAMDPINWQSGGLFSIACRVMTNAIDAGTHSIISKYIGTGNQRSWALFRNAAILYFYISDDGTNTDNNSITALTINTLQSFVSTFDPSGGSGACVNNIYYNAYQIDTDATMTECVPFNSTAPLQVGAIDNGSSTWDGSLYECTLWDGVLSAIDANKYISPYFPKNNNGDGFYVDTCTQAASHATCSTQKCRDGTPNACQAEGTGVIANFGQYTELCVDNSFESPAGDDSNPNWPDWNEAGDITVYRADTKHGDIAVRTKGGSLTTSCLVAGIGADLYIYLASKLLSGSTGTLQYWIREYDTGFCTNQLAITYSLDKNITDKWTDYGGLFTAATWNVATSSYTIQIVDTVDGDILIDDVSIKAASYHTPWVENPTGAGTTTYNLRDYRLHNPLSDYVEAEDGYAFESGFCVSSWVYSDWSGDDGLSYYVVHVVGTAGNANRWHLFKGAGNTIQFTLYDNAAASLTQYVAITSTTWTPGSWKYIEFCSDNTGNLKGHHYNMNNQTWYDWTLSVGAGTGIQSGQATSMNIGHASSTSFLDGYQGELYISPYSAIYPMKGFNSGNPPPCNDGKKPY